MHVTTITGPGRLRGLDYGRMFAREIATSATALKTYLAANGTPPGQVARRLAHSELTRAAADLTPDLWAEVSGMATGSRLPLEDVLMLTFLDEVWALRPAGGCSVLARVVPGAAGEPPSPSTTEIGQTVDLPAWTSGRSMVLRVAASSTPTALFLAYPGCLGLCGANESGLGVAVNSLPDVPISEQGLGVALIVRHLLTLATLADAEAFLTQVPHASGQAYTIAARDGIAAFEAGPGGVHRLTAPGAPACVHTNHSLVAAPESAGASRSSSARLEVLTRSLELRRPLADVLTGEVVLDGQKWDDHHLTFGAFRAVGSEPVVRFIDGAAVRTGHREWSRFTFH
jgi:isopenicillin-N N-acyltransferase like protein